MKIVFQHVFVLIKNKFVNADNLFFEIFPTWTKGPVLFIEMPGMILIVFASFLPSIII